MGGWTWRLAVTAAAMSVASLAYAQAPGPELHKEGAPASATRLHLSAEGSVSAEPDELVADLAAEARSPSAAEAQRKVNAVMSGVLKAAAVQGVRAEAVGYSVHQVDAAAAGGSSVRLQPWRLDWLAQQTLELRASQGDALLDLAGRLQEQGFAVTSLDWRLSPALSRRAHDQAMVEAIKALRARAAAAASALGLEIDRMEDVRVDARQVFPVRGVAMRSATSAAPPEATSGTQAVTAEVSADVLLKP